MKKRRAPETNSFGLVLPPDPEKLKYLELAKPNNPGEQSINRHHLYWPAKRYNRSSPLAKEFRDHPFNSVWLLTSDHMALHNEFNGVPVPPKDVMEAYLEEAVLLEELGVCIRAVEMIDAAIYEGRVSRPDVIEDHRQQRMETICEDVIKAGRLEIIQGGIAELTLSRAVKLVGAA